MELKEKFRLSALRKLVHFKLKANKSTDPLELRKRRSPAWGLAVTCAQSLALTGLFLLSLGGFRLLDSYIATQGPRSVGVFYICCSTMWIFGSCCRGLATRKWNKVLCDPCQLRFPQLCPACLSADPQTTVKESSQERITEFYIVISRMEWFTAKVPYCRNCKERLSKNEANGILLWLVLVILVWIFLLPAITFRFLVMSAGFGFPPYLIASTASKGIVFGRLGRDRLALHVKRIEYLDALNAAYRAMIPTSFCE